MSNRRWNWGWFEKREELFEGTIAEDGFQISRIIRYRNKSLPVIHGRFYHGVKGVRVEVTMRLHVAVLIFSIVWFGFFVLGAVSAAYHLLATGKVAAWMLTPFGILLFSYIVVMIGFGIEAEKASKLLSQVFEAESLDANKT